MPLPAMSNAVPWSGEVRMNGRPKRDVDAAVEIDRLDRDQRLVVIHAQRRVVAAPRRGVEHRVGGERPARVDAGGAQRGDRRRDDVDVLAAERAGLAGMRVEPGDRDDRRGDRRNRGAAPRRSPARHGRSPRCDSVSIACAQRAGGSSPARRAIRGQASIITAGCADPASSARYSVWPGWRKPAR